MQEYTKNKTKTIALALTHTAFETPQDASFSRRNESSKDATPEFDGPNRCPSNREISDDTNGSNGRRHSKSKSM